MYFPDIAQIRKCFVILFLVTNFLNRDIASMLLIVTLVLCLFDFNVLMNHFNKQRDLIISILLFISSLFITGIINDTALDEYDNYMRILLLTPLLVISLEKKEWKLTLTLCLCAAILHMFLYTNIFNRPMSYIQGMQATFSGTANCV